MFKIKPFFVGIAFLQGAREPEEFEKHKKYLYSVCCRIVQVPKKKAGKKTPATGVADAY